MLAIVRGLIPYPNGLAGGEELRAGWLMETPLTCKKCRDRACLSPSYACDDLSHHVCSEGLSFYAVRLDSDDIRLVGLLDTELNTACRKRRALRRNRVWMANVREAMSDVEQRLAAIRAANAEQVKEGLAGLHDIKTAVNVVYRCMDEVIQSCEGSGDDERIENADPAIRSLLHSIALLRSRLNSASIAANPEAAKFGQRRAIPVYRAFHRMVRFFRHVARINDVSVSMAGGSFRTFPCYDSFETLTVVLIDNAVKYAQEGSGVIVRVEDVGEHSVKVCVTSLGPIVPENEVANIFDRGFRATTAVGQAASGAGLGLHMAALIADAHGCEIEYEAVPNPMRPGYGSNNFAFVMGGEG